MKQQNKIKVMIVDDSISIRLLLQGIISQAPDMEVVATAADPIQAIEAMKSIQPDVMTLDVEMPNMDGLTFLQKIMNLKPLPVVMVSTLTSKGSETALKALEIGAVDVIGKPSAKAEDLKNSVDEITSKIREAALAKVGHKAPREDLKHIAKKQEKIDFGYGKIDEVIKKSTKTITDARPPIIAIGSSTGGPQALQTILGNISPNSSGIVVSQHMSNGFIPMFVKRLNNITKVEVVEAKDGDTIKNGHVYIAPTLNHLAVKYKNNNYVCHVFEAPAVSMHLPSVDVLFRSIANEAGKNATAIILTGMGSDGANSMKEIKDAGGMTIAQDEETSIVFGMPRVAIENGGINKILPLDKISTEITK